MAVRPRDLAGLALCAGAGGLELGLEMVLRRRAGRGLRTVCAVEGEAYAAAALVARMEAGWVDPAPVWSDLRTFDARPWRGRVDCITAGYPCQPFSAAGQRRGADDPRHLWPHVLRIAEESGAWLLACENVGGHLRRGFDSVVRDLDGAGWEVACVLAQAADVGAPHKRERLFFLAHRSRERLAELGAGHHDHGRDASGDVADGRGTRVGAAGVDGAARCDGADVPDTGGVALRELAERREGAAQPADAGDAEPGHAGQPRLAPFPPRPDDAAGWGRFLARYPDAAPIVEGDTRAAGRRAESALRRGVDGLAAWLGEHPRDAALGLRVDQLRLLGNGVVPAQAAWSLDHCLTALLDHDPNPHGDP